jgi:iron complex outermembrane recepter protein
MTTKLFQLNCTHFALAILAANTIVVAPALAQSAPDTKSAPADALLPSDASGVGEIVVTAQRKNENLQKVPLTVQAFSAKQLDASGITSTVDLARVTPGLAYGRGVGLGSPFLRGVGTGGNGPGVENTVAVYVDGVYYASKSSAISDLENIERVEVLKGPQGTLFGRNASGGLIQIVTTDPTSTPELRLKAGYGNYDTVTFNGFGNVGLTDDLAVNVGGSYSDQGRGWGKNLVSGKDINLTKKFNIRGKAKWTPSDATSVTLTGDYAFYNSSVGIAIRPLDGIKPRQGGLFTGGQYDVTQNIEPFVRSRIGGVSLKIEHDLDFAKLVSTTAWRADKYALQVDGDTTPTPFLLSQGFAREKQYSQEFQLSSDQTDGLQWTTGVYLFYYSGNQLNYINTSTIIYGRQRSQSAAVYGQATKELFAGTRLTLGGRFTWETRKIDGYTSTSTPAPQQKSFRKPTWRIALEHDFAPDVLGYVSYNRGFKSGTFNSASPASPAVNPEIVDAYEAGLKTTLFDRKVRFNTAGFYYNFRDIQLTSFVGVNNIQILRNAARAEIYGIDVDFEIVPTDRLRLSGSAEWLHARFTKFLGAPIATADLVNGGNTVVNGNASGNQLIRAPSFSANVMANYTIPVREGSVDFNVSYTYTGRVYQEADNYLSVPPLYLVNAQISWAIDHNYKISVWGRNLTNKFYYANSSALFQASSGAPAEPRTYGVTVGVQF